MRATSARSADSFTLLVTLRVVSVLVIPPSPVHELVQGHGP